MASHLLMDSGHSATGVISRWPNFWSGMKFRCFLCGPIYAGRSALALMFPGLSALQVGPTLEVSRLDDRVWEIALADKINVRDAPIAIIPCALGAKIPGVHPVPAPQVVGPDSLRLKTDEGWTAAQVAATLDVSERTVFRTKQHYAEEGLEEVLRGRNQSTRRRKLDDRGEAHLVALACSPAPEGHDHLMLRALAGKEVELRLVESLSHETVRLHLKKAPSSRGRSSNGASPK